MEDYKKNILHHTTFSIKLETFFGLQNINSIAIFSFKIEKM